MFFGQCAEIDPVQEQQTQADSSALLLSSTGYSSSLTWPQYCQKQPVCYLPKEAATAEAVVFAAAATQVSHDWTPALIQSICAPAWARHYDQMNLPITISRLSNQMCFYSSSKFYSFRQFEPVHHQRAEHGDMRREERFSTAAQNYIQPWNSLSAETVHHNSFICLLRCVQRCDSGTLGPQSIPT